MKERVLLKRLLPFLLVLATLVGILCLVDMPRAAAHAIIREGGPVETATAAVLWIGGIFCLGRCRSRRGQKIFWLESAILFCAMAIRESDPHRVIPGFDFMRLNFYANGDISIFIRLFFGISFLALFGVIANWGLRALFLFIDAFKKRLTWTFTALAFLAAEITGCLHHKAVEFILRLFLPISKADMGLFITALEEPLELTASILLLWTAVQIPASEK